VGGVTTPTTCQTASFHLPTNVLFLAKTRESPSIEEQRAACEEDGDLIVDAGEVRFVDLPKQLARQGHTLRSGDKIKVYDFSCLPINTMTLIRMMMKVLRNGIAIEFCQPGLLIEPAPHGGDLYRLTEALDNHWRRVHGIKTHMGDSKPGRKKRINDDQLTEIRAMLAVEGATVASVAKSLNVGRTTLFDFLRRHGDTA
jgi:transcriptional regulator of acetoin/glycerol metabolism